MPLRIEDCIEITQPTVRQERVSTMDIYWPSFWAASLVFLLYAMLTANACGGLSEAECAAVNNYCSNGGCF